MGRDLSPEQALQPDYPDQEEHGIQFICLNANISRQFEFVQGAWIMSTKFDGMSGESDPLLGNRQPIPGCPVTDNFLLAAREWRTAPRRRRPAICNCSRRRVFLPARESSAEVSQLATARVDIPHGKKNGNPVEAEFAIQVCSQFSSQLTR